MNNKSNKIPTMQECFALMHKYSMFDNIIKHSVQVKNVALKIYENLIDNSHLNIELIIASALLHDITKTQSILKKTHEHEKSGAALLEKLGMQSVARVIAEHVNLFNFDYDTILTEQEIIFYADKRVMHDKIVSIEERVNDIILRYAQNDPEKENFILASFAQLKEVESKIEKFSMYPLKKIIVE